MPLGTQGHESVDWPGEAPGDTSRREPRDLKPFPAQSLERTLLMGNLPGIRTEPARVAAATLAAYVENYLEEEIRTERVAQLTKRVLAVPWDRL